MYVPVPLGWCMNKNKKQKIIFVCIVLSIFQILGRKKRNMSIDVSMFGPGPTYMMQDCNFSLNIRDNGEIVGIVSSPVIIDEATSDLIEIDLNEVGFIGDDITLYTEDENEVGKTRTLHKVLSNKGYFTIGEMIKIIIDFERIDRPKISGFCNINTHHVFYEGIHETESESCKNSYNIFWGS